MGSSAFTARPAGDRQQVMLHSRPGCPELAWGRLLRQVALSGVGSRSGWRRTLGESAAECGPGLCCPSRRSPWVSLSESSGQCPGQVEQSQWWLWSGAEPDLVSEPWLDHFPGAWFAHPHSGQEAAPCARHAAPQTENRDVRGSTGQGQAVPPPCRAQREGCACQAHLQREVLSASWFPLGALEPHLCIRLHHFSSLPISVSTSFPHSCLVGAIMVCSHAV